MAGSATKSDKEPSQQLIPFDQFSYQKLLRILLYILRLLPSHECYRNVDGSKLNPLRFTKLIVFFSISLNESVLIPKKDILANESVERSSHFAPFSPFMRPNVLIRSAGRIKRMVEVDYDVKHPNVLDARHIFVKLFLRHNHLENHHQVVDYLRAKLQERYVILKLRSSLRPNKSNSVTCRMFRAAIFQSIMVDLPIERFPYKSFPSQTTGSITWATFTILCVLIPRRGGIFSSLA